MKELLEKIRLEAARLFIFVLLALYAGNVLMVVFITPLTHIGAGHMPLHLCLAFGGSAVLIVVPILLCIYYPASVVARHAVAVSVGLECSLATALSGGQIEMHFSFFIAMVFLALALDPAILWTFVLVVFADHAIRGWVIPDSVYGCSIWQGRGDGDRPPLWLAAEHAGFVGLQLLALLWFIKHRVRELAELYSNGIAMIRMQTLKTEEVTASLNQELLKAVKELEAFKSHVLRK